MRSSIVAIAAAAALSCASTQPSANDVNVRVSVTELRGRSMAGAPTIGGTHLFRVRIRNNESEPLIVERIDLEPSSIAEVGFDNGSQTFNDTVGPGETLPFDVMVNVGYTRPSVSGSIDSLRVTIAGRGPRGSFVRSASYSVGAEAAQD